MKESTNYVWAFLYYPLHQTHLCWCLYYLLNQNGGTMSTNTCSSCNNQTSGIVYLLKKSSRCMPHFPWRIKGGDNDGTKKHIVDNSSQIKKKVISTKWLETWLCHWSFAKGYAFQAKVHGHIKFYVLCYQKQNSTQRLSWKDLDHSFIRRYITSKLVICVSSNHRNKEPYVVIYSSTQHTLGCPDHNQE